MILQAVFFDLGGVLLRTEYQAPREHLAERLNLSYEELCKTVFESESARRASLGEITTDQHWASVAKTLAISSSEIQGVRNDFFGGDVLDRDLLGFIRGLRAEVKTGLISNGWPDVREYIARNKFDDVFDDLVISAEVGVLKPAAAIYRLGLERVHAKAESAAFVDDMATNVEAARALGMHGILFNSTPQVVQELTELMK
jgi:epoxide hydrolase-like predicted phosphatase